MNDLTKQAISYPDRLRSVKKNSHTLASAHPTVMEAFERFHQAAGATGARVGAELARAGGDS